MVYIKKQICFHHERQGPYGKMVVLDPVELVKEMLYVCLIYIIVNFIHQNTHAVLCGDSVAGMFSSR